MIQMQISGKTDDQMSEASTLPLSPSLALVAVRLSLRSSAAVVSYLRSKEAPETTGKPTENAALKCGTKAEAYTSSSSSSSVHLPRESEDSLLSRSRIERRREKRRNLCCNRTHAHVTEKREDLMEQSF